MQNSIELNLSNEGFSIPSESMNNEHIFTAIKMLYREIYYTSPNHMVESIYQRLSEELEFITCENNFYEPHESDDLPF